MPAPPGTFPRRGPQDPPRTKAMPPCAWSPRFWPSRQNLSSLSRLCDPFQERPGDIGRPMSSRQIGSRFGQYPGGHPCLQPHKDDLGAASFPTGGHFRPITGRQPSLWIHYIGFWSETPHRKTLFLGNASGAGSPPGRSMGKAWARRGVGRVLASPPRVILEFSVSGPGRAGGPDPGNAAGETAPVPARAKGETVPALEAGLIGPPGRPGARQGEKP
jgi:hypothetical protein